MSAEIPTSLYRHFAGDGSLLYVGISLSWPARTKAHARGSEWFAMVAEVKIEHFPSRQEALDAEREAIRREQPKFNVVHNRGTESRSKLQQKPAPIRRRMEGRLQRNRNPLLDKVRGPHAIVGPALVYHRNTISVMVAHGVFGTEGELTELVLGEFSPEPPQWTDACAAVITLRRLGELTIAEARGYRREIVDTLTANLTVVQSFETDLALATAYATQFPSNKSRQLLDQVISERRQ